MAALEYVAELLASESLHQHHLVRSAFELFDSIGYFSDRMKIIGRSVIQLKDNLPKAIETEVKLNEIKGMTNNNEAFDELSSTLKDFCVLHHCLDFLDPNRHRYLETTLAECLDKHCSSLNSKEAT